MGQAELSAADRALIEAARDARENAYAPISRYKVGVALRDAEGAVHRGANVENIVLSLTSCAEATAVHRAVADGKRAFDAIAVVTADSPPASPCGSCRQLLAHWGVERVLLANPAGEVVRTSLTALLPRAFALPDPPE